MCLLDDDAVRRSAERSLELADKEKLCRLAAENKVAALELELSETKSELRLKEQAPMPASTVSLTSK